jgi:hypothetical protein
MMGRCSPRLRHGRPRRLGDHHKGQQTIRKRSIQRRMVNSADEGVQRALLGKNPQDPSSRETLAQYRMLVNRAALLAEDASSEVR